MHSKWIVVIKEDEDLDSVLEQFSEFLEEDWFDHTQDVLDYMKKRNLSEDDALKNMGYTKNDNGEYGYYGNEHGLYDWYEVGGRWAEDIQLNDPEGAFTYDNMKSFGSAVGFIIGGEVFTMPNGQYSFDGEDYTEEQMRGIIEGWPDYHKMRVYVVDMHC